MWDHPRCSSLYLILILICLGSSTGGSTQLSSAAACSPPLRSPAPGPRPQVNADYGIANNGSVLWVHLGPRFTGQWGDVMAGTSASLAILDRAARE